jgi:hypothetical protein
LAGASAATAIAPRTSDRAGGGRTLFMAGNVQAIEPALCCQQVVMKQFLAKFWIWKSQLNI